MILNYPPFLLMDPKCYVGYHVLSFPDYETEISIYNTMHGTRNKIRKKKINNCVLRHFVNHCWPLSEKASFMKCDKSHRAIPQEIPTTKEKNSFPIELLYFSCILLGFSHDFDQALTNEKEH